MKKLYLVVLVASFASTLFAQNDQQTLTKQDNHTAENWVQLMHDPNASFYDVQKAFYEYWDGRTVEKGKGYKAFKRWENYMIPRVYPSGDMTQATKTYENFVTWSKTATINTEKSVAGNWQLIGPIGKPVGGNAGRLNFLRFDPVTTSTMYVGAPDGGLWKSTNSGASWTTNTDQLAVIGCTDLVIDPNNTQTMYLATGDGDAGDSYSVGVLKSTDGGTTWNTSGMNWTASQGRTISKLIMDPTNSNVMLAATSIGIWRTINAGASWSSVSGGVFYDIEFKPGDPTIVYAAGSSFRKSTNNGASWATITSGLATSNVERIAIAVTPANAAYVYLLYGQASDQGLLGVYRSTDSGTNFTQRDDGTKNLLGWNSNGGDAGGQAFYDLTIAASNTSANDIYVGGVNIWRSTNGGTSWSLNSHWTGSGAPFVHSDHHDIEFLPGSGTTFFSCNDGGLVKTSNNGTSWTDLSSNLAIAQQYRIGLSASDPSLIISGHQDNGTNVYNGIWTNVYGGDGMDCFIDRTNDNIMVGSYVYGDYYRSTNGGSAFNSINTGIPSGDWLSVIHQDPQAANTYFAGGRSSLYKTTNAGSGWNALGTPNGSNSIIEFAIAPSNNQIIYAVKEDAISKSTNGGTSWTNISAGLPVSTIYPTNVAVSNTNPNVVYVTFSGYTAASKVYVSTNGGTNWTSISGGLPNVPCNTIAYTANSSTNAVYVGTDIGVYYKDDNLTSWTMFSTNLPRVSVRELEIYAATGRIRAATFGRGTWDSDLYTASAPPVAGFTASLTTICTGQTVTFTNTSSGSPTSYSWSFPGGTPSTSTATNPTVTYNTPGTYSVDLSATNSSGTDVSSQSNLITVTSGTALPFTEGFTTATFPPANWTLNDLATNGSWARTTDAGNAPTLGNSMVFDNFAIDDRGSNDEIKTPRLDLSLMTSANLAFDVAYAPYDAVYLDSLEVLISSDCGSSFSQLYLKSGTTLATAPAINTSFTPASGEWRTENINLSPYIGNGNVILSFKNHSGYGNRLFLDNINITGVLGSTPVASFSTSGNSICAGQSITYTSTSSNNPTSLSWTFEGGSPATSTISPVNIVYNTSGNFDVQLQATNAFGSDTDLQSNSVTVTNVPATPGNISGSSTFCANSTNNAYSIAVVGGALSYTWSVPAGAAITSGQGTTNITVNFASTSGMVSVTADNLCGSSNSMGLTVNPVVIPIPTISASGPTTFCSGNTVTLTSSASSNNTWSTGQTSQSIVVSSTGNYSVAVSTNGCTASSTPTSVTVNPVPLISLGTVNNPSSCGSFDGNILVNGTATGNLSWTGANSGTLNGITLPHTINGLSAGNYSISFNNGCVSNTLNPALINPGAPPTPSISASGTTSFCTGSSVTLTSSSATNNAWSTGATTQSIIVTTSGTYTVTVTNASCFSTSAGIVVTVNPLPNVTISTIPDMCNTGASITLNQGSPTGGTYSGNGVSGITFDPALAAIGANPITYTFSDINMCTNSAQTIITVTDCLGITENLENGFRIYPNPTNDYLIIKGDRLMDFKTIQLIDAAGKIIKTWQITSNEKTLDLSNYPSGNYKLKLLNKSTEIVQKIQIVD